jgi:hypothetical protein
LFRARLGALLRAGTRPSIDPNQDRLEAMNRSLRFGMCLKDFRRSAGSFPRNSLISRRTGFESKRGYTLNGDGE